MRIGVIGGAGKIGQLRISSVGANPATGLAAVLDPNRALAESLAGGAPVFDKLEEFLKVDMDAVIVSSPLHFHDEACIAALETGRHVLVEKPMANTVAGCRAIVDAGRKAGKAVATGFNMRYYPAFAHVKDVVDRGEIGEVDHIRAFGGHGGLANFQADWQYRAPQSGGGAMWDVGIHMTDLVHQLLGEITSVYGVASENVWHIPGSEDNAVAIFKNPDGLAATYQATWNEWKGYSSVIEVYGNRGMVRGAYAPMHNMLLTQTEPGGRVSKKENRYFGIALREKLKSWKTTALLSFEEELRDFISLTEGKTGLRIADGRAGMRAIEVAAAVAESTASGRAVELPALYSRDHEIG